MAEAGTPAERVKVTATDIERALMKHFAPPGHRIFFEVGNDTGAKQKRWIDAVACGVWPSTGQEFVGIEIKVSRSDWQRELKDPLKAQELMRFCNRWYLACPAGMVKPDELPATWGMLALDKAGRLRVAVPAKQLDPQPPSPGFVMAMMRKANAVDGHLVDQLVAERVAEARKTMASQMERQQASLGVATVQRNDRVIEAVKKLEEIAGAPVREWPFDTKAMAATYRLLKASNAHDADALWTGLPGAIAKMQQAQAMIEKIYNQPALVGLREAVQAAEQGRTG